jgi:hypothetical protein
MQIEVCQIGAGFLLWRLTDKLPAKSAIRMKDTEVEKNF